jgi:hypothetical protein
MVQPNKYLCIKICCGAFSREIKNFPAYYDYIIYLQFNYFFFTSPVYIYHLKNHLKSCSSLLFSATQPFASAPASPSTMPSCSAASSCHRTGWTNMGMRRSCLLGQFVSFMCWTVALGSPAGFMHFSRQ